MRHQLAVQDVVRRLYRSIGLCHLLLRPQAVVVVGKLHHIFRLGGKQLAFRRNAAVQLRARSFDFAIFQCVDVAPAGRDLQFAVDNLEGVVRVQCSARVRRVRILIYGDAAITRPVPRQRAGDLHVAVQVGFAQGNSLLPRMRGVPGRVRARVPAVAFPRKGAGLSLLIKKGWHKICAIPDVGWV